MKKEGKMKDMKVHEFKTEDREKMNNQPEAIVKVTVEHADGTTSSFSDFSAILLGLGNDVVKDGEEGLEVQAMLQGGSDELNHMLRVMKSKITPDVSSLLQDLLLSNLLKD